MWMASIHLFGLSYQLQSNKLASVSGLWFILRLVSSTQGTCTYVMATVAKPEKGMTLFTITTKNDHRGNRRVSFVRTVTININTLSVVISRHRGKVQVKNTLQLFYSLFNFLFDKGTYFSLKLSQK